MMNECFRCKKKCKCCSELRDQNYNFKSSVRIRKPEGQKVLIQGKPSMGMTTIGKKIAFDWAKGKFTRFIIIFLVILKLAEPDESIETIISNQLPELTRLDSRGHSLKQLLENFGEKCLIILDGLDEIGPKENKDISKTIRGEKLRQCHIVVTSRPHSTAHLQQYFSGRINIKGFNASNAKEFAFKILNDEQMVDNVLNFNPSDFEESFSLFECPILLSFMCHMAREQDTDLTSQTICTGDIYMRMIICLYKIYTINKQTQDHRTNLVSVLEQFGKFALDTLLSGNTHFLRSSVVKDLGEDVFKFGLLIGDEDYFKLSTNPVADIAITFLHTTIQEFLGALYFVLMLAQGKTVDMLLGSYSANPIFLTNKLFLHFCCWALYRSDRYVAIDGLDARKQLKIFCRGLIPGKEVNIRQILQKWPALSDLPCHDQLRLKFL